MRKKMVALSMMLAAVLSVSPVCGMAEEAETQAGESQTQMSKYPLPLQKEEEVPQTEESQVQLSAVDQTGMGAPADAGAPEEAQLVTGTGEVVMADTWLMGELSDENTADDYTLTLPTSGWLTITLQGGTIMTAVMQVLSEDTVDKYTAISIENSTEEKPSSDEDTAPLAAGNYTIRVNRYGAYSSGLQPTNGTYQIKYSFKSAESTLADCMEEEPNDSFEEAMVLSPGVKVCGLLALNDGRDFFRIDVPEKQKVTITCTAMLYTWLYVIDSDLEQVGHVEGSLSSSETSPTTMTFEEELDAGFYFVRPTCGTNFNSDHGRYYLKYELEK